MSTPALKRRWVTFSLRTFLVVTLGIALVLGYVGRARIAAERERKMRELIAKSFTSKAWVERPTKIGKPNPQDAAARDELLQFLEEKQDAEFRRDYRIVVPDHSTGLPRDYDVLMYGSFLDWFASRLEVRVRDGKAQGELFSDEEVRRGELPIDVVDNLVRQLAYGHLAQDELRKPSDYDFGPMWVVNVSHAPSYRFEVESRSAQSPFHLITDDWPLVANDVSPFTAGTQGAAHTLAGTKLMGLLTEQLPMLQPDEQLRGEIVQRMAAITPPAGGGREDDSLYADPATLPLDYYRRHDLPAVEALIYSRLAIDWRVAEAAPELRRLNLRDAQVELAIVTADDPTNLLRTAMTGDDWGMFTFAVDFMLEDLTPEFSDLLVQTWPHIEEKEHLEWVLTELEREFEAPPIERRERDQAAYEELLMQLRRLVPEELPE